MLTAPVLHWTVMLSALELTPICSSLIRKNSEFLSLSIIMQLPCSLNLDCPMSSYMLLECTQIESNCRILEIFTFCGEESAISMFNDFFLLRLKNNRYHQLPVYYIFKTPTIIIIMHIGTGSKQWHFFRRNLDVRFEHPVFSVHCQSVCGSPVYFPGETTNISVFIIIMYLVRLAYLLRKTYKLIGGSYTLTSWFIFISMISLETWLVSLRTVPTN